MTSEQQNHGSRIESRQEVGTYLARLKYALKNNSIKIKYQENRRVDIKREDRYTNDYIMKDLFTGQNPIKVLTEELLKLNSKEYIETVKDINKPSRSEMRVYGKIYEKGEVYIKIRVELCNVDQCFGSDLVFVMSFHYSTVKFTDINFPYGVTGGIE